MNRTAIASSLVVLAAFLVPSSAQNTSPSANAGKDSTIQIPAIDQTFNMWGETNDTMPDGTPDLNLVSAWTKISGPDSGFTILYPDAPRSRVTISAAAKGAWVYRLSATDGQITVADTVRITVIDSLPFLILTPTAGQKVLIGSQFLITWQFNQMEDVLIYLSTDDGLTFELIQPDRWGGDEKSWLWPVSDTLKPSDQCRIKVRKYRAANRFTVSEKFSLVDTLPVAPADKDKGGCGSGAGLAFVPVLGFKLAAMRKKRKTA